MVEKHGVILVGDGSRFTEAVLAAFIARFRSCCTINEFPFRCLEKYNCPFVARDFVTTIELPGLAAETSSRALCPEPKEMSYRFDKT